MKNKIRMFLPLFLGLSTTVLADYYVVINGSQQGPHTLDQLQSLKNQGALTKESLVWQQGMAAWAQAGSRSDLQNLFTALAPPPMPANNASVLPPPISPTSSSQMMPAPSDSTPITQSEVDEHNRMSDANLVKSASDSVDDWANLALTQFNREAGEFGEKDGKIILFASESVSLKPLDPQYGNALINAFNKALQKNQEQYVLMRFGQIATESVRERFSNTSTNARELDLPETGNPDLIGKILVLLEKSLDVADKKLDNELLELGASQSDIQRLSPKLKKDLFRDKFIKNTLEKASGSVAGLFVLIMDP